MSVLDIVARIPRGNTGAGSTFRTQLPATATLADVRQATLPALGLSPTDSSIRLFVAGQPFVEGSLGEAAGRTSLVNADTIITAAPILINVMPPPRTSALTQAMLQSVIRQARAADADASLEYGAAPLCANTLQIGIVPPTSGDSNSASPTSVDDLSLSPARLAPEKVLAAMLASAGILTTDRAPGAHIRTRSTGERAAVSDVERAEVELNHGRLWTVNDFVDGTISVPPAHSTHEFHSYRHAVEVRNCVRSIITIKGRTMVHLNMVNCRDVKIYFRSVVCSVELTRCENVELHMSGTVPTLQIDMSRIISIHAAADQPRLDRMKIVCANTFDVDCVLQCANAQIIGGPPVEKVIKLPVSLLSEQTASKLHQQPGFNVNTRTAEIDWTVRTLTTSAMKTNNSDFIELGLLDSSDFGSQSTTRA